MLAPPVENSMKKEQLRRKAHRARAPQFSKLRAEARSSETNQLKVRRPWLEAKECHQADFVNTVCSTRLALSSGKWDLDPLLLPSLGMEWGRRGPCITPGLHPAAWLMLRWNHLKATPLQTNSPPTYVRKKNECHIPGGCLFHTIIMSMVDRCMGAVGPLKSIHEDFNQQFSTFVSQPLWG